MHGTTDTASILNKNTYGTNAGKSMTHIINGMTGNIEDHSELRSGQSLANMAAMLNMKEFGFSKMMVVNSTALKREYIRGSDGTVADSLWPLKPSTAHGHHSHHEMKPPFVQRPWRLPCKGWLDILWMRL